MLSSAREDGTRLLRLVGRPATKSGRCGGENRPSREAGISEQEREYGRYTGEPEQAEVEGHLWRNRGDAEAPKDAGERSEEEGEGEEPDVEGHLKR